VDEAKFWKIVEASRDENQETQCEKLEAELRRLDRDALIEFDRQYRLRLNEAYHWDLWAAAFTIAVQDQTDFEDFRYVMGEVFTDRFGGDMPFDAALRQPAEPAGTPFDESEAALSQAFPGLYKTYWGDGASSSVPNNTETNTENRAASRAKDIWADDTRKAGTQTQQPNPAQDEYNPFLPQPSGSYKNRSGFGLFGTLVIAFLFVSIIASFFGRGDRDRAERGPSQIELSMDSPLYFARLCEIRVKWWGQDRMYADGVGDVSAQTYQRVRSVKPVNIRKDIDGRIRWDVVVKTATDSFNCSDFADNYGGEIGRKQNPVLEKIRE